MGAMKVGRTLAPAAAPVGLATVLHAGLGALRPHASLDRASRELKSYLRAEEIFFVSSGKAALTLTLQALATLGPARRVAIPAYTCFTVPAAVIRAGLEPVLIDVDPDTLDFADGSLKQTLDRRDLLAIVPTHLFGVPADVERLRTAVAGNEPFVVEDAAQALGVTSADGRPLGSIGDVGVFSLARGKHLTAGAGGFVTTSSPRIAAALTTAFSRLPEASRLRSLRIWIELAVMTAFIHPSLYWLPAGLPFLGLGETVYEPDFAMSRLPAAAAGALDTWRARLEESNRHREAAVEAWQASLDLPRPETIRRPLLRLPVVLSTEETRLRLVQAARLRGLGVSAMYPSAIHQIPELRARFSGQRFPGAEALAARLVTLPTHQYVGELDRRAVRAIWPEAGAASASACGQTAAASC
jgi:dTDP-4-amino-4,6-dideoxygalactose transaminase